MQRHAGRVHISIDSTEKITICSISLDRALGKNIWSPDLRVKAGKQVMSSQESIWKGESSGGVLEICFYDLARQFLPEACYREEFFRARKLRVLLTEEILL